VTDIASTKRFVLVDSDQIELNDTYNKVHKVPIFMRHYCHSQCFSIRDLSKENKLVNGKAVGNAGTNVKVVQYSVRYL
jgi:poly(3-hydroxyalkanoate) synthetase